jgi:hypothetical protein
MELSRAGGLYPEGGRRAKMPEMKLETYKTLAQFESIGNSAVRAAQEESRRLGVPNVYSLNGKLFFELPNGEITDKDPFEEAPPK